MMFILLNTTVGKAKLLLTIFFLLVFSLGYSQCCDLYVKMEVADDLFGEGAQVVLTVRSNGGVIYTDNFDSGGTGTKTAVINVCEGDNIQFEVNDSRFIPFSTTSLQVLNSNGVLFQSLPDPSGTVFTTSNACSSGTLAPCSADAGTVSVFVDGVQVDETQTVYICYDQGGVSDIGVYSNDDVTLPPPYPGEVSELMLAVFTCPRDPSIPYLDFDPCWSGLYWTGDSLNDRNDASSILVGAGLPTELWYYPVTVDDSDNNGNPNGIISHDQDGDLCYDIGTSMAHIVYLTEVTISDNDNCNAGETTVTINGGLPAEGVGQYTLTNLSPAGASFASNTVGTAGGTVLITGLNDGDTYSFDIDDGNGCITTVSGTLTGCTPCSDNAGTETVSISGSGSTSNDPNYALCTGDVISITNSGASPSVDYAIYNCAPTGSDPASDACFTGYYTGALNSMTETGAGDGTAILTYLSGQGVTVTNNTVWYVPITTATPNSYNTSCFDVGQAYQVTYLNDMNATEVENCGNGEVTVTITGGYPEMQSGTYAFTNTGSGVLSSATASPTNIGDPVTVTISGLLDGEPYSLSISDGNGCVYNYTGGVFIACLCNPPVATTVGLVDCSSVDLANGVTNSSGGVLSYYGALADAESGTNAIGTTVNTSGTYYVRNEDPADGQCYETAAITVDITGVPTVAINSVDAIYCEGSAITPLQATTTGGTITWYDGTGAVAGTGTSYTPLVAVGTQECYTVQADAGSCQSTIEGPVCVTVSTTPAQPIISGDTLLCEGVDVNLTASGSNIAWYSDAGFSNLLQSGSAYSEVNPAVGTSTVYVLETDLTSGCTSSNSVTVQVLDNGYLNVVDTVIVCEGESVVLIADASGTVTWSDGTIGDTLVLNPLTTTVVTADMTGTCNPIQEVVSIIVSPNPVIDAGADQLVVRGELIQVQASGGVTYDWQLVSNSANVDYLNCPTCATRTGYPLLTSLYVVSGYNEYGCQGTDTLLITVEGEVTPYVPNIFSPNGDGENDYFGVRGPDFYTFKMSVLNRWGEIVFETEDAGQPWDGTWRGKDAGTGVYYYYIEGRAVTGIDVNLSGNITLVR